MWYPGEETATAARRTGLRRTLGLLRYSGNELQRRKHARETHRVFIGSRSFAFQPIGLRRVTSLCQSPSTHSNIILK